MHYIVYYILHYALQQLSTGYIYAYRHIKISEIKNKKMYKSIKIKYLKMNKNITKINRKFNKKKQKHDKSY